MRIRVVAHNPLVQKLLELFVEAMPDFCLGEPADLILLDARKMDCFFTLKRQNPSAKIAVMTDQPECTYLHTAKAMDADGFWYQVPDAEHLRNFLLDILAGEKRFPEGAPVVMLGAAPSSSLTERELEVLREIAKGKTNAEIAAALSISVPTVKHHIQQLLLKTKLANRTQLAVAAVSSGLIFIRENYTFV